MRWMITIDGFLKTKMWRRWWQILVRGGHWHGIGCWLARCRSQNFIWQVCRNPSWIEKQERWIGSVSQRVFFQDRWQNMAKRITTRRKATFVFSGDSHPSHPRNPRCWPLSNIYPKKVWTEGGGVMEKLPMSIINQGAVSKNGYFFVFSPYLGKWSHLTNIFQMGYY